MQARDGSRVATQNAGDKLASTHVAEAHPASDDVLKKKPLREQDTATSADSATHSKVASLPSSLESSTVAQSESGMTN